MLLLKTLKTKYNKKSHISLNLCSNLRRYDIFSIKIILWLNKHAHWCCRYDSSSSRTWTQNLSLAWRGYLSNKCSRGGYDTIPFAKYLSINTCQCDIVEWWQLMLTDLLSCFTSSSHSPDLFWIYVFQQSSILSSHEVQLMCRLT